MFSLLIDYLFLVVICVLLASRTLCDDAEPLTEGCPRENTTCYFYIGLQFKYTMMNYKNGNNGLMLPVVYINSSMAAKAQDCSAISTLSKEDEYRVIKGDGSYKMVLTINGSVPGPPIVVYKWQRVEVVVENRMEQEVATVMFHQPHSSDPIMAGISRISHCAINPNESFLYSFEAETAGTHMYHVDTGTHKSMGAWGAFVVLDTDDETAEEQQPSSTYDNQYVMQISDWFHNNSYDIFLRQKHGVPCFYEGMESGACRQSYLQSDGAMASGIPFDSAVIDGRGRVYDPTTGVAYDPDSELTTYYVTPGGQTYNKTLFRVISGSMAFPLRLCIDDIPLTVVALDGAPVQPYLVDCIVLHPNERFDVEISASNASTTNFWIRVDSLETEDKSGRPISSGYALAILRLTGGPKESPTTTSSCSEKTPCTLLNCPFKNIDDPRYVCVSLMSLKRNVDGDVAKQEVTATRQGDSYAYQDDGRLSKRSITDINNTFLSFQYTTVNGMKKPTVNGRQTVLPSYPPQIYKTFAESQFTSCSDCASSYCKCTQIVQFDLGEEVQLVLTNLIPPGTAVSSTIAHPVEVLGLKTHLVKIGYPAYNSDNQIIENTPDLKCLDDACATVTWSNESREQNLPDSTNDGIFKNTVSIPVGGYVVLRATVKATGYWAIRSTTEFNRLQGMFVVLKLGETNQMTKTEPTLARCGDYLGEQTLSTAIIKDSIKPVNIEADSNEGGQSFPGTLTIPILSTTTSPSDTTTNTTDGTTHSSDDTARILVVILAMTTFITTVIIIILLCKLKNKRTGYSILDEDNGARPLY